MRRNWPCVIEGVYRNYCCVGEGACSRKGRDNSPWMEENAAGGENLRDTLIERGTNTVWEMEPAVKVENDWSKWSQHFLTSLSKHLINESCLSALDRGKEQAMCEFKTLEKKIKKNQLFLKRNSPQWNRKRIAKRFPVSKNQAVHSPCGGPISRWVTNKEVKVLIWKH